MTTQRLNRCATAPIATKKAKILSSHNLTRTDNYYWMRDDERPKPREIKNLNKKCSSVNKWKLKRLTTILSIKKYRICTSE